MRRATFHTDSADIVGLMCIENSASGGRVEGRVLGGGVEPAGKDGARSSRTLTSLSVDRKGEVPPGPSLTYDMPVFHRHGVVAGEVDGSAVTVCVGAAGVAGDSEGGRGDGARMRLLSGIYDRNFIDAAQARFTEDDGVPRLTPTQIAALDALDATCDDPSVRLDMRLEPGDVQWLHNHTTFHARSAYSDGDGNGPSKKAPPAAVDHPGREGAAGGVRRAVRGSARRGGTGRHQGGGTDALLRARAGGLTI